MGSVSTAASALDYDQQPQHSSSAYLNKSPRRTWSSIAFSNKNFPDGKFGYENSCNSCVVLLLTRFEIEQSLPISTNHVSHLITIDNLDFGINCDSNANNGSLAGNTASVTGGAAAAAGGAPGTENNGNSKYFAKGFSKFERSSQEVMARASQIVQ